MTVGRKQEILFTGTTKMYILHGAPVRRLARSEHKILSFSMSHQIVCIALLATMPLASRAMSFVRPPPSTTPAPGGVAVSYFAYGANMATKKVLEGRRRITPLCRGQPAVADGYRLAFTLPGISPSEPAFASLELADDASSQCHGVVYSLSPFDWLRLCASEGVPFGYQVIELPVRLYDGRYCNVFSLQAARMQSLPGVKTASLRPSERYLSLLREGARENKLSAEWLAYLDDVPSTATTEREKGARTPVEPRDYESRPGATFV